MKLGGVNRADIESKPNKKDEKVLSVVLFCMGILILVLIVVIVAVAIIKSRGISGGDEISEVPEVVDGVTIISDEEMEEYQKASNEIMASIRESGKTNEGAALAVYEQYASKMENKIVSAMLRADYLNLKMAYDSEKREGTEITEDALKVDKILGTINSGVLILNIADYYGNRELYEQYEQILNERETAMGIDMDVETEG